MDRWIMASGGARIWVEGGQNLYMIYAFTQIYVNI